MDGRDWLARAATGGLPEPARSRWQPLRVGIVNLWEYDDAEFWFADGRLVLRGGNGAGKTKVLELTTLMLLRGEVAPTVLDPFGSQHRTMRYNLLPTGDADDPRPPADAGLGYAWVEFGRRDESGHARFVVCGLGASARRGSGTGSVATWQFLTELRPGKDLVLSRAGRLVDRKELAKVAGVDVLENATRYRARVAVELFGMDSTAYDNLTELLKQLRKPKLGERLNPATLADTLRDALPPLATTEVEQLADGWDRLEKLRGAVEATKKAAKDVATFATTAWLPWARTFVRRRADALSTARTKLDDTTKDKNAAEQQLAAARKQVEEKTNGLNRARQERVDTDIELRELLESRAYLDAVGATDRVSGFKRELASLTKRHAEAEVDASGKRAELSRQMQVVEETRLKAERATLVVAARADSVDGVAGAAGLAASTERSLAERDVDALRADLQRRRERFRRLRSLDRAHAEAQRKAELSAQTVREREDDDERARRDERQAQQAVTDAVDSVQQAIRAWAAGTSALECSEPVIEQWCDLAVELADRAGSPARAIREHAERRKDRLRERRSALVRRRDPFTDDLQAAEDKLAEVKRRKDLPPPPPVLWQRADRPSSDAGAGAPLWQCVQPAAGLAAAELDRVEAALAASGLLDAWLTPDGRLRTEDGSFVADTSILAGSAVDGDSLAAVLEATPAGGVAGSTIDALLRGVGWYRQRPEGAAAQVWLAADGAWRLGVLAGRAEPHQAASYLGATARAEARRREIHALDERIADLTGQIAVLNDELEVVDELLSTVDTELAGMPREEPVAEAATRWDERRRQCETTAEQLHTARSVHREHEEVRDTAWAEFSTFAAEHHFPLHDLDEVDAALSRYQDALGSLEKAVADAKHAVDLADVAAESMEYQSGLAADADSAVTSLAQEKRAAQVRVEAAERALTADHAEQLRLKSELDERLAALRTTIEELEDGKRVAERDATRAETLLGEHEARRAEAEGARDAALAGWWELYDAQATQSVGLDEPDSRTVEAGRVAAAQARRELAPADEHAERRALTRCTERLHTLQQQLLPNRNARLDDESADGIPRFFVTAHSDSGWQLPVAAADVLAQQVREQEERFDAEQQEVLATLLGSAFIEHLKDRLDYTKRTFAGINRQLAAHATRHGHAVRLNHEPDPGDPDAGAVVTALNQGYSQLSPARQDLVRGFLARKIDEARSDVTADHAADWKDELSAALDYRRWLRISLEYRPGAQAQWRAFDRAQHGAKSGGEKVVLLSQPLFAAAVVSFEAAGENAPRWVWLDEAMTGVDGQYKASFMGLTVGFDLDVMLTAHDEWCTYTTVPAVAVYDLARHPHLAGVDAQPHLWHGGELRQVAMAATGPPPQPPPDGSLFAEQDEP